RGPARQAPCRPAALPGATDARGSANAVPARALSRLARRQQKEARDTPTCRGSKRRPLASTASLNWPTSSGADIARGANCNLSRPPGGSNVHRPPPSRWADAASELSGVTIFSKDQYVPRCENGSLAVHDLTITSRDSSKRASASTIGACCIAKGG